MPRPRISSLFTACFSLTACSGCGVATAENLIIGGDDQRLHILRVSGGDPLGTELFTHAWSAPSATRAAFETQDVTFFYNAATAAQSNGQEIASIEIDENGRRYARLWNPDTGTETRFPPVERSGEYQPELIIDFSNRWVLSAGSVSSVAAFGTFVINRADGSVKQVAFNAFGLNGDLVVGYSLDVDPSDPTVTPYTLPLTIKQYDPITDQTTDILEVRGSSEGGVVRNGVFYMSYNDFPQGRFRVRAIDLANQVELPEFSSPTTQGRLAGITDQGCAAVLSISNNGLRTEIDLLCPGASPRHVVTLNANPFTFAPSSQGAAIGSFVVWEDPDSGRFFEMNVETGDVQSFSIP